MKLGLLVFAVASLSGQAFALDCDQYADRAVTQYQAAAALNCGFSGLRWQDNWQGHFDFCSMAGDLMAQSEDGARVNSIQGCLASGFVPNCNTYAFRAVHQVEAAEILNCGVSGLRWIDDASAHHAWCMSGVPVSAVAAEDEARRDELKLCVQ